jgi:hypothetical protein
LTAPLSNVRILGATGRTGVTVQCLRRKEARAANLMSTISQVFLLFYAVLYGAIFTISDRWRPFLMPRKCKQAGRRFALSTALLGILPVGYFLLAFPVLESTDASSRGWLALAVYQAAPLMSFYFSWVWIVIWKKETFYSPEELRMEPTRTSMEWVTNTGVSFWVIGPLTIILFVVPFVLLILVSCRKVCVSG